MQQARSGVDAVATGGAWTWVLGSALVAGCASGPVSASAEARSARVLVQLATPSLDRAEIVRIASIRAGVEVRYAAAVSGEWHALVLDCPDARACERAVTRMRAAADVYRAIEFDEKKRPAT